MSYTTAITELRQWLADTEFHKKATKKSLIGNVDGNNQEFVTYDKRILEDTLQVYVNDDSVDFTLDDSIKGLITLSEAPDINTKVRASYYWQFWTDDELKNFLNKGAESTGQFTDAIPDNAYLQILPGLKTGALYFAASIALGAQKNYLIMRRHSEEFLIEQDGNTDTNFTATIGALEKQEQAYWDKAVFHRDDFYKRLGKRNAPAFAIKQVKTRRYGAQR